MALIVFAISLFSSAFLLFLVQPVIGKFILPALGGTPQVWNTCMMFFQTVLLTGYFYTHSVTTRFPLRRQIVTHIIILSLPLLAIFGYMAWAPAAYPFDIRNWTPPPGVNPIVATLKLLAITVGIPFFVVSTSAPLLQKWFASTGDPSADDPYFLSVASNIGSLSSLLLYPVLIEPYMERSGQTWLWTVGFGAMILLFLYAASMVWNAKPKDEAVTAAEPPAAPGPAEPELAALAIQAATAKMGIKPGKGTGAAAIIGAAKARDIALPSVVGGGDLITFWRCLHWILLAAVPSSLMLGVISYVSVDLSPFPLLWVVPLSLYLMSFILVFVKDTRYGLVALGIYLAYLAAFILIYFQSTFYALLVGIPAILAGLGYFVVRPRMPWTLTPHRICIFLSLLGVVAMCVTLQRGGFDPVSGTGVCFLGFFFVALVCHGEMAKDRPSVKHLTLFFLMMSVGGMVGGVFNGLFAPIVFKEVLEFPVAIILACLLHPSLKLLGLTEELILDANPQMRNNLTKTGNEWAKAVGMIPPNRPYPLSWAFDVLFAVIITAFAWLLKTYVGSSGAEKVTGWFFEEQGENYEAWAPKIYALVVLVPPLIAAVAMSGRGLRYGLAILGVLGLHYWSEERGTRSERVIYADRSYFGVLKVYSDKTSSFLYQTRDHKFHPYLETSTLQDNGQLTEDENNAVTTAVNLSAKGKVTEREQELIAASARSLSLVANKLMHGTTHHGLNFQDPRLNRLATTYYHRYGPVGSIMEQYNWFPGRQNTYHADARLPASIIGNLNPLGASLIPAETIAALPTEPPIAIIGLGTGTMASYGRPFGHVTYYEIDDKIRNMSLPADPKQKPYFGYLRGAEERGCNVEVVMGDARLSMEGTREKAREEERQKMSVEERRKSRILMDQARDGYYKVIVVDAFSSDAIPIHLITKEAIQLYLSKLAPDGVLCVHTSNRHMTLINPVSDIAYAIKDIKDKDGNHCDWLVGTDSGRSASMGHFASEYIMVVQPRPKDYQYMDFAKWQETDAKDRKPFGNREWGGWLFPVLRGNSPFIDYPNLRSRADYANWLTENADRIAYFQKKSNLKAPPPADDPDLVESVKDYLKRRWNPESEKQRTANRAVRLAVFPQLSHNVEWYRKIHPDQRLWTDDYSNILAVLHRGSRGQQEEPKMPYPNLEMKASSPPAIPGAP